MEKKYSRLGINLATEEKNKLMDDIKYYFETEREEKLGILATEGILDLFMDTLGGFLYNKALDDTKRWYSKRMEDIEADFYSLYKPEA